MSGAPAGCSSRGSAIASEAYAGGRGQDRRWIGAATVALAVLAWPFGTLVPGIDGDWNWVAGLAVIAEEGHRFGDQLIWNYGPLGFLHHGALLYYDDLAALAFAYHWALQLLLAATLYVASRRSYPAPVAFAIAFVVLALITDRALLLGFAWCVLALTRPDDAPRDLPARWFPAAIGVLAGILVLSKLNQGVTIVALAATALIARPGRRPHDWAAFAGAFLATAAVGWLATGQALAGVWLYVRYGAETIGGYPAAAGVSDPDGQWHYWAALLIFALGSTLVWRAARDAAPVRRWGLVALWLIFSFATFKQGFVRHGDGHVRLYMASMLMALAVLPVRPTGRWLAVTGAGIVACAVLSGVVTRERLDDRIDPYRNAEAALAQAGTMASSEKRARRRAELATAIRDHYSLPPRIAAGVGDRPVAFWPFAAGDLAYALGVEWRSLPVIEPYGISTPALDDVVAGMLASSRAPDRIVRKPRPVNPPGVSLDPPPHELMLGPPFEPPLTTRAVFCRYRELARSEPWQLLARAPDRCGRPREVESVVAAWGEAVEVPEPRPGSALLVEIEGSEVHGLERLKALWLRPDARVIVLDDHAYRLVPSTASRARLIGAAPDVDYRAPLELAPNASRIAVRRLGDEPDGELRYTFLELPVRRPSAFR